MFKVGDKVRVGEISKYQQRKYGYNIELIGVITKIDRIDNDRYYVYINGTKNSDGPWWFPIDQIILIRAEHNKWNPLNYKSHFEPLKLP